MRVAAVVAATCLAISLSVPLSAQEIENAPSLVPVFNETCLMPGVAHADRLARIEADERWTKRDNVSIDIGKLGISRSMQSKPSFEDFVEATEWQGSIDGLTAKVILISFEDNARFKHACVIMVEGLRSAMPFSDELKEAFETFGIKRKSVDLVHYFEFGGTLKPGEHPVEERNRVHGEIFTRSQAGSIKETTHIYVAY